MNNVEHVASIKKGEEHLDNIVGIPPTDSMQPCNPPQNAGQDLELEHKKAWEQCQGLATEKNILDCFLDDFRGLGVVGEDKTGKLIYLAITSRFLDRPVSIAVKGPSSGGKSYCIDQTLKFFPDDAYHALTAMSDKALAYSDEPLKNRFLIIYEAAGMESDITTYLIRSLLSEGKINYETVEKTKEGIKSRLIVKEGPTGLIVTTTRVKLHPENETRLFSIPVKDTRDQTKAVFLALAEDSQKASDLTQWQALQTWLKGAEHEVIIPYAKTLAEKIPPIAVRLRRDFTAILHLIKAHALLHQLTRERDDRGRVIAEIKDYAVVRGLVSDIISEGVEATVPQTVRETVEAVESIIVGDCHVTVAQVSRKLKLDKSSALRRVKAALGQGYLKNDENKPGRPYKLKMGDELPEDQPILPESEGLQGCSDKSGGIPTSFTKTPIPSNGSGKESDQSTNVTDLMKALKGACKGLPITPEQLKSELVPNDYPIFIKDPEYASRAAKTIANYPEYSISQST